jgi:lipopolysaccharide transport system ATP-binding protein
MYSNPLIIAKNLSKAYLMYKRPQDRLKQMLFRGRSKYYEEFWALKDLNLEIYKGETVGIIGRNGSGKSTLLQMICGTLTPTVGSIQVNGRVAALLELGAGFNPDFTGIENVYLNAAILGLTNNQIDKKIDSIISFADIGNFINQPVKSYSSGMYARLAFAVAVHVDPEILIVDEILAVGDAAFQRKCVERFYQIKEQGTTVLFVSHDQYQVKNLCDRAVYLKEGKVIAIGPSEQVVDQYSYDLERAQKIESGTATDEEPKQSTDSNIGEHFRIEEVHLEDDNGTPLNVVKSGQSIQVRFKYKALTNNFPNKISLVYNLYRHDEFYISGATSLMEKLPLFDAYAHGEIVVKFPSLPLIAGRYIWRVAINDAGGLYVHAQAKHVCPFQVIDDFKAVGLVELEHTWSSKPLDN